MSQKMNDDDERSDSNNYDKQQMMTHAWLCNCYRILVTVETNSCTLSS